MQRMSQSSQKTTKTPSCVEHVETGHTLNASICPTFQYYLDQPDIEWTCPACALPQQTDSFFKEVPEGDTLILAEDYQRETT